MTQPELIDKISARLYVDSCKIIGDALAETRAEATTEDQLAEISETSPVVFASFDELNDEDKEHYRSAVRVVLDTITELGLQVRTQ